MDVAFRALSLLSLSAFLTGCLTPPICVPENAYRAGESQALGGGMLSLSQGQVCPPEDKASFERAYSDGFKAGQKRLCSPEFAFDQGKSDGSDGSRPRFARERVSACGNVAGLEASYDEGYQAGLAGFCVDASAESLGFEAGRKNAARQSISERFGVCQPERIADLSRAYERGYLNGLEEFQVRSSCSAQAGGTQGEADARVFAEPRSESPDFCAANTRFEYKRAYEARFYTAKRKLCLDDAARAGYDDFHAGRGVDGSRRFPASCPRGLRDDFLTLYLQGYCSSDNAFRAGKKDAESASPRRDVVSRFRGCPASTFSTLATSYARGLNEGQRAQEREQCSVRHAEAAGEHDARRDMTPLGRPPQVCTGRMHDEYRRNYEAAFEAEKRRICRIQEAAALGLGDARLGRPQNSAPHLSPLCPSRLRREFSERYDAAYQEARPRQQTCRPFDPYRGESGRFLKVRAGTSSLLWPSGKTFLYSNPGMKDDGTLYYPDGSDFLVRERGLPADGKAHFPDGRVIDSRSREFAADDVTVMVENKGAGRFELNARARVPGGEVRIVWMSGTDRVVVEECSAGI